MLYVLSSPLDHGLWTPKRDNFSLNPHYYLSPESFWLNPTSYLKVMQTCKL